MTDTKQETYEELHIRYNKLQSNLKKLKYKNRKVNRKKYNLAREEAAKSDCVNDIRQKYRERITTLNESINEKDMVIANLQEECSYWIKERRYIQDKFFASLAFGIISCVSYFITLRGVENCICE